MMIEHGEALRLGRVRGENRLHADTAHLREDVRLARTRGLQARELIPPQAMLGGDALVLLAQVAHRRRGTFLDHVQELKRDRVCETETRRRLG